MNRLRIKTLSALLCCPRGGYQDLEAEVAKLRRLHLIIVDLQHSKQRQSMAEKRVSRRGKGQVSSFCSSWDHHFFGWGDFVDVLPSNLVT